MFYAVDLGGKRHVVDVLRSYEMSNVVVEATSRCNLRCVFCPKANDSHNNTYGRDMDMPDDLLEHTYRFLDSLGPMVVAMVGIGEPTFHQHWMDVAARIKALPGKTLSLNTNFGQLYSDREIDALLDFSFITISVESADYETQKRLRKAVDLRTIIYNILRLKMTSHVTGKPMPMLTFNCTVSDQNVFGVARLAALARELAINLLSFSSLYEFEMDNAVVANSIEHMEQSLLTEMRSAFASALSIVRGSQTKIVIQPRLQKLLEGATEETIEAGATRVCVQPWGHYTVGAEGAVYPCCVTMEPFATITDPNSDILNGSAIRSMRRRLLTGDVPDLCKHCSNAPLGSTNELLMQVLSAAMRSGQVPPQP
jgi:MoaA/NifB/PqqE/SkfB family radical SAM enzyme